MCSCAVLLLPEWMEKEHFEAARSARLFAEEPDTFVGLPADLEAKMSLASLRNAFRLIDDAGARRGASSASRLATRPGIEHMVSLRNDGVFALRDRERRRQMCGRPWQAG